MKNVILSCLIFLSCIILMQSSFGALLITCPSNNINITAYSNYKLNCTFNNTYGFDLIDVNIYNNSFLSTIKFNLPALSSQTHELNFYTDKQGMFNTTTTFNFYYYVNSTLIPENKEVNIYNFEFRPNVLEITQGSIVTFYNKDNYNIHSVVDQGSEFSSGDIPINGSWQYTFNTIKNYTIRDGWVYGNYMLVRVKNPNELILTHNNDYDVNYSFNITSTYTQTTLNTLMLTPTFSGEWNDTYEGVVSVQNNGSSIAKNIKLVGEWISFSKNNFDLNPGQTTYVNIELIPYITQVSQTNKTYYKFINLSSDNSPLYSLNYSIFINYSANVTVAENQSDWVKYFFYKKQFCDTYPKTKECLMDPIKEYIVSYNCSDMQFNITTTVAEWQRYLASQSQFATALTDLEQTNKEGNDIMNSSYLDLLNKTSESLDLQKENKELGSNNMVLQYAMGILLITLVVGGFLIIDGWKKQKQKHLNDVYNIKNEKYYKGMRGQ